MSGGYGFWTRAFWKATAERAISTGAQTAVAALTTSALPAVSLPWQAIAVASGLAALLSVLKSLAVNQATGNGPGLTTAEQVIDDE